MSAGLIINGARVPVPGLRVVTWEDDPRVPQAHHGKPRDASSVTGSIVHTSRGVDARITRETGSPSKGLAVARYLGRENARDVSAHLVIAGDGTVYQLADLATWHANHAGQVNDFAFGVEVAQERDDPSLTLAQVRSFVAVMHAAHDALKIPKRLPMDGARHISEDVRAWLRRKDGGEEQNFAGCAGHRNTSTSRGKGDPGDVLMEWLRVYGFVGVSPAAMTCAGTICTDVDRPEDDDPPEWPEAPPSWLDLAQEIDAARDITVTPWDFVATQAGELAGLVPPARIAGLIAHAYVECRRGERAHGHNLGGIKARRGDGLTTWWRDYGHLRSGDADVVYYRGFPNVRAFWEHLLATRLPRTAGGLAKDRYLRAGRLFWDAATPPHAWFAEWLRAGYRGETRAAEVAAIGARGGDVTTHPSVRRWLETCDVVRGLM